MTERAGLAVAGGPLRRAWRAAVGRLAISVVALLMLSACGSEATPSESPVVVLTPIPVLVPDAPGPAGTPMASPTPQPTPNPVTAWTKPTLIYSGSCGSLRGGIDAAGYSHVVAVCGTELLYASTRGRGSWFPASLFGVSPNRVDQDPQIAFQGKTAYFAYSRLATREGGCGDDGLRDIGVFYLKRALPRGAWSSPVRIGKTDDHLVQFRVDGTTFHVAVRNEGDGRFYYLRINGATSHRYLLPALASLSLRVGSDGRARIAYSSKGTLRIATFTGSGFSTIRVPAINARYPVLVLDSRDRAHLVWSRNSVVSGGGCADGGEDPAAGMYYGTNASGTWHSERLTHEVGEASFQVDRSTGQVHLVISTQSALTYYTKASGGGWQHEVLGPQRAMSPAIARDAATGRVLILYIDYGAGTSGIYAMSKGG
jgi:hypothetical protein